MLDTIEKLSTINLSSYRSKCYASVVLRDSKVAFLEEGEDAAFGPFINSLHNQRSKS